MVLYGKQMMFGTHKEQLCFIESAVERAEQFLVSYFLNLNLDLKFTLKAKKIAKFQIDFLLKSGKSVMNRVIVWSMISCQASGYAISCRSQN